MAMRPVTRPKSGIPRIATTNAPIATRFQRGRRGAESLAFWFASINAGRVGSGSAAATSEAVIFMIDSDSALFGAPTFAHSYELQHCFESQHGPWWTAPQARQIATASPAAISRPQQAHSVPDSRSPA